MDKPRDGIYCKGYRNGYLDGYKDGVEAAQKGECKELGEHELLCFPVEAMEITTRARYCLIRLGCRQISDLLELREESLLCARNLGNVTAAEIAGWLERNGFAHTAWSRFL